MLTGILVGLLGIRKQELRQESLLLWLGPQDQPVEAKFKQISLSVKCAQNPARDLLHKRAPGLERQL